MGPDQGTTGGPVESRRRNNSVCENDDAEKRPQAPQKQEQEEINNSQTAHGHPRRCEPIPRAAPPLSTHKSPSPVSRRPLEPPVTKATLSELDTSKIIHNSKLRHDINYDPELHFRPNMDGEKGRKKSEKAQHFWDALKEQLAHFIVDRPGFYAQYGSSDDWCLPVLLKTIKEIIQTLVPHRDREVLDEGLNVELLMQQFHKGIADLDKLSQWLGKVLKSHCAPMRDEWVDQSCEKVSSGNRNGDLEQLVDGLKDLLSVLESMKLDVANHQIRCLRPVLIEETVHFERRHYWKKINAGKLQTDRARDWYGSAERKYTGSVLHGNRDFGETGIFFEALAHMILPSTPVEIPSTFQHDYDRIMKLRSDMTDAVNLEICMRTYENLARMNRYNSGGFLSRQFEAHGSRSSLTLSADHANSRPSSFVLSSNGSDTSSPRSSLIADSTNLHDDEVSPEKVRQDLTSLLQQADPASSQATKWQMMCPSMALQIHRQAKAPMGMLSIVEDKLMSMICDPQSAGYQEVEQTILARLLAELSGRVREFKGLSGLGLFSAATGARSPSPAGSRDLDVWMRDVRSEGSIEDMSTRVAHLGILHWRVWSVLVYQFGRGEASQEL